MILLLLSFFVAVVTASESHGILKNIIKSINEQYNELWNYEPVFTFQNDQFSLNSFEDTLLERFHSDSEILPYRAGDTQLPLKQIFALAVKTNEAGEADYYRESGFHQCLVHIKDLLPFSPVSCETEAFHDWVNQIHERAWRIYEELRPYVLECCSVFKGNLEIFISGHRSGSAIAQAVALLFQSDCDIGMTDRPIFVYSISLGDYQIFSQRFLQGIKALLRFRPAQHIVFRSVEHYFAPSFGNQNYLGSDIRSIGFEDIFRDNATQMLANFEQAEEPVLLASAISEIVESCTALKMFAGHFDELVESEIFYSAMSESNYSMSITTLEEINYDEEQFPLCYANFEYEIPKMLRMAYPCLRAAINPCQLSVFKDYDHGSYSDYLIRLERNAFFIELRFRVFPGLKKPHVFADLDLQRERQESFAYGEDEMKDRKRFGNWVRFFEDELALEGRDKRFLPFYEESILFIPAYSSKYWLALIAEPMRLMHYFLSNEPEVISLVKDVFGPGKPYKNIELARSLIQTPYTNSTTSVPSAINWNFDNVLIKLFETPIKLQRLVDMAARSNEPFQNGKFTFLSLASFCTVLFDFKHDMALEDVGKKIQRLRAKGQTKFFHDANCAIPSKHVPNIALEITPSPLWKRIIRVGNVYFGFCGADSFNILSQSKSQQIIMAFVRAGMTNAKHGSFMIFEVKSLCHGFGPCAFQGVFYMIIAQNAS